MDTQGYEGFVLRGAAAFLASRPPLVLEFWPYGMNRSGSYPLLREALKPYSTFIDLDAPSVRRPISELDALREEIGPDGAWRDILLCE
jgi:hypothetical protein